MSIEIRPLILLLLLGFLLLVVQLRTARRGGLREPELRSWAYGTRVMLLGFAMVALREWLPLWVSVLFGNGLGLLALALYTQALYRFVSDRPLPPWYCVAAGTTLIVLMAAMELPVTSRVSLYSVMAGTMVLPACWQAAMGARDADEAGGSGAALRSLAWILGAASVAFYGRALHAQFWAEDYQALPSGNVLQVLTVLIFFFLLGAAGFGFVLAHLERETRRMRALATIDGLTGCVNRSTTDAMLAQALNQGQRDGRPLAFALLDLDHFKRINDQHGHPGGDAVLRAFAAEVRRCLRVSDVLGRVGGEEFALILPGTDGAGADQLLENVRAAVEALAVNDGQGRLVRVTVSAGICVAEPAAPLPPARLYALADRALYRAKSEGRNRAVRESGNDATPAPLSSLPLRC